MILTGKCKGLTGKVIKSLPRQSKVVVEGMNMLKRHQRPRKEGQKGQIIDKQHPIAASKVMLADAKKAKDGTDIAVIKKATEDLSLAMQKIGEAMMSSSAKATEGQENGTNNPASPEGSAGNTDGSKPSDSSTGEGNVRDAETK